MKYTEKTMLIETIGDSVENRILDFLIGGISMDYSKKDIADGCGISRPTVYKMLPKMLKEGTAKKTRMLGRSTLYTINKDNKKVQYLLKLEEMLLKTSFEELQPVKIKV